MDELGNLSIDTASSADAGVLSATDWNSFNDKVASVSAGTGLILGGSSTEPQLSVAFGTTSGSAAAGDDPRLSDARAPTAGSGFYIQNASGGGQQNASINISGDAIIGGNLSLTGTLSGPNVPSLSAPNVSFSGAVSAGSLAASTANISVELDSGSLVCSGPATVGSLSTPSGGNITAGGTFVGDGSTLTNLGAAQVSPGQTLAQALASANSNSNATSIKGVPVNDSAKADGYVLGFSASSGDIVYLPIPGSAYPPPSVPTSVSWSTNSTGNAQCAAAKGVCTQASTGSCSAVASSGSATCAQSASIDSSFQDPATGTGDAACTYFAQGNCVQAYDANGNAISCSATATNFSGSCLKSTAASGWNVAVSWSAPNQSGQFTCELQGADCVQAFNNDGSALNCAAAASSGIARCLTPQTGASWDRPAIWASTASTGDLECARHNEVCFDAMQAGPGSYGTYSCSLDMGGTQGYTQVARCRPVQPSDGWDSVAIWAATASTGDVECARVGKVCVNALQSGPGSGGAYACGLDIGGTEGYTQVALCRALQASDVWTSTAIWADSASTGDVECARLGAVCVKALQSGPGSAGTYACGLDMGGTQGYTQMGLCRALQASDGWTSTAIWADSTSTGYVECGKLGLVCVNALQSGPGSGGTYSCGLDMGGSQGYTQLGLCRAPTTADGWNTVVTWADTTNLGNVQCALANAECFDVAYSGPSGAAGLPCTTSYGGSGYTTVAHCQLATLATAGWDTHVTWTAGQSTNGAAACAAIGGTCVGVIRTSDGTTFACTDSFTTEPGLAKCAK